MSFNTLSLGYEGGEGEQAKLDKSQTNGKPDIQLGFCSVKNCHSSREAAEFSDSYYELNLKFVSESQ